MSIGSDHRSRLHAFLEPLHQILAKRRWRSALFVFWAFFLGFVAFRALLWIRLAQSPSPPLGFMLSRFWPHEFIAASGWDALLAAFFAAPLLLADRKVNGRELFPLLLLGTAMLCVLSLFLAAAHMRMLLDRGESLGLSFFREASGGAMTLSEAWSYGKPADKFLVALPVLVIPGLAWGLRDEEHGRFNLLLRIALVLFAVFLVCAALPEHRRFHKKIHHNPLIYAAAEYLHSVTRGPPADSLRSKPVSPAQQRSLAHLDPQFLEKSPRGSSLLPEAVSEKAPLNVVVVIMESTGSHYVFQTTPDGKPAMPYLKDLASRGLWMQNHYSTANSSHRSLFSIFSGLYPSFGPSFFCITPEVTIPTSSSFLPESYEQFLITPGELRSYFPRSLLERSGFTDLKGKQEITLDRPRSAPPNAHNEFDVLDVFLRRLESTRGPFFGVYYTYTPHFHYFDYGPDFHAFPKESEEPLARYVNNLRVLDEVLRRLEDGMRKRGLWENTVLVLVGDHGEGFGQHEFFTHGNDSHDQALKTPFFLHFPGVIPRSVTETTSHVDLLPSLLDLLQISYEPRLFQGESLFSSERRRRYVFSVGNEQSFSAVDNHGHKVLQRFRRDTCEAYDLSRDPYEKEMLPCSDFPEQYQALSDFRLYQTKIIQKYSRNNASGAVDFFGHSHPRLKPFRLTQ